MPKPSIVSKVMTLVKGVFGQKTEAPAPASATIPVQQREPAEQPAEKTDATPTTETAETAEKAEKAAAAGAAAPAEPTAPVEPEPAPDTRSEASAPAAAAEPAEKPAEDTPADEPPLVAPEEKAAVAEEIAGAEAITQVAGDEVLEKVRKQSAPAAEELPVPGYDGLTLPSIRARLRKLTIDQVRDLRAYEIANAERPEFVKMYDNRIAKLQKTGE